MPSRAARSIRRAQLDRFARMSPDERVALARRLGEEGLASYMATHGVDRATAVTRIRATRRLGRPESPSDLTDDRR